MKRYLSGLAAIAAFSFGLTGCLKDKGFDNNEYQSLRENTSEQKVVSLALTTTLPVTDPEFNVALKSIGSSSASTIIDLIPVTLAGGVVATQDVHVVLDLDNTILDDYNNNPNGSFLYELPNPAKYTIVSKTVTIPAGQSRAYLQIKLTPDDLIAGPTPGVGYSGFALPVKIVSVDGGYVVAANRGKGIGAFVIKNAYAGTYIINEGSMRYPYTFASFPAFTYNVGDPIPAGYGTPLNIKANNGTKEVTTLDANTVLIDFANLGAPPNSFKYVVQIPAGLTGNTDYSVPTTLNTAALAGNNSVDIKLHTYNPVTKTFKFVVLYRNAASGGDWRLLFESCTFDH